MSREGFFRKNAPLIVTLLVCICAVSMIYSNSLNGEFVFDDKKSIRDNISIRMDTISVESINKGFTTQRPVALLSFAFNYYFHGYDVKGYHLFNIAIHLINSILIFFLFKILLSIANYKEGWQLRWLPVITACIWAVNPVHTQSVTYIVQRMTSMATMFYILSFICYLKGRTSDIKKTRNVFFILSVIAGILAVKSKEIAVTLPFFILLYEWLFFRDTDTRLLKKYIYQLCGISLIAIVAGYYFAQHFYSDFITTQYSNYNFDMLQRCLTEFRVVIYYVGLMLLPHPSRLNIDYDFTVSNSLFDPFSTLIAIFVVAASIAGAFYLILGNRYGYKDSSKNKLLAFCILWYFGNLFIESSFIPLDMVFEHRTYLPSVLLFLMIIILLIDVLKSKAVLISATVLCVAISSYWTLQRNKVWQTEKSLWLDTVAKSPDKGRPYLNIGNVYVKARDSETAYKYYIKALSKKPAPKLRYEAYVNVGKYHSFKGDYKTASTYYDQALAILPRGLEAQAGTARVFAKQKKYERALEYFNIVLKAKPNHVQANAELGDMYYEQNKLKKALQHYNLVLKLAPEHTVYYCNRAILFMKMGETDSAMEDLSKAISFNKDQIILPYIVLGRLYTSLGDFDNAVIQFEQADKINPDSVDCHDDWAYLLIKTGDFDGGIYHLKRVVEIDPENMRGYQNLGTTLFEKGDIFGALVNLKKALQLEPDNKKSKRYHNVITNLWGQKTVQGKINLVYKYLEKNKKDPYILAVLGKLHYLNSEYLLSLENWEELLTLEPDNFMAMNNSAICYMTGEMFLKAAGVYEKMMQRQPENQIVPYNLACAYSASGEFTKSVEAIKIAISKGFSDIDGLKKDPDLAKLIGSDTGKNFLLRLDSK